VTRAGVGIDLTPLEFKLLEHLMLNQGRVVTRTMLLERVWGFHFDPKTNVVETHVSRLRSKIDKGFASELIRTARGSGYILRALDADPEVVFLPAPRNLLSHIRTLSGRIVRGGLGSHEPHDDEPDRGRSSSRGDFSCGRISRHRCRHRRRLDRPQTAAGRPV